MLGEEPISKRKSHEEVPAPKRRKLDKEMTEETKTSHPEPEAQTESSKSEDHSEDYTSMTGELDSNSPTEAVTKKTEDTGEDKNASQESDKVDPQSAKLERKPVPDSKAKFGANLFTTNHTPLNSFNSSASSAKETPTAPNTASNSPKPTLGSASSHRPVFGATTSFGKSIQENLKNRKSVFDAIPSLSEITEPKLKSVLTTSSFGGSGSFGANLKFGNAFQESLKKKSFLDETKDEANGSGTGTGTHDESETRVTPQQFKQVELEKIEHIQTGEEDEISRFATTAKLFELDLTKIVEGWKERGLGSIHVNQSKSNKVDSRIVMRSNGLLRVILNYKITPESKLLKGLEASLTPGKFVRFSSVNTLGAPVQFLLKLGSEKTRDEFYDVVEEIKTEIEENKESA